MNGIKNLLFLAFYLYSTVATAQYITVDDTKTDRELVENVLVKSACANVSSFGVSGDTFTAGQNSYAKFTAGSNFPFTEGVVLSTWSSRNSIGPFDTSNRGDGDLSWKGDTDLEQALGITKTYNATILEFDFTPLTNLISFNYLFASSEYQSYYPCNFSDGFAFLIKEDGATNYTNLAVIPGTNTPVSSKNIHPIINPVTDTQGFHNGCSAIKEEYFGGSNISPTNTSPINYAGQTVVLNAQSNVIIGKKYHIKLVIADQGGNYYNSAIFLQAGSFKSKIDLGPDRLTSNNPICFGESLTIDTKLPTGLGYIFKWYKDNSPTPMPGATNPSYIVTAPGTYRVEVELGSSACPATDEIKIDYAPEIILKNTSLIQCDNDNDGITVFDLTKADAIVKNNNSNISTLEYYESQIDAQGKINPIINPAAYKNTVVANQTVIARVVNTLGCVNYAQVKLIVSNNPIAPQNPIESCDLDAIQDGLTQFNLNTQITSQVINGLPSGLTVEYYLNQNDAIAQKNQLPNLFTNTIPNQQIIYARIVNGPDCFKITPETLVVNTFDPPNFQDETFPLCNGSNINLTVASGFSSYSWSNGSTTNTTKISTPGEYTVTVTNTNGCKKTKKFIVKASGIGLITNAVVTGFSGTENSVLISYSGDGDYQFSLDDNIYQDNPLFTGVNAGIYSATVRDKNGCGISIPYKVYVLDYPRFFTPNNDGYNDTWKIKNLDVLPKSTIAILDRFGKLLKQLGSNSMGWNGTYNDKELPADDYWFIITFEDGKIIKGHFSLKR
jgi:gliding motility-associated-like protein